MHHASELIAWRQLNPVFLFGLILTAVAGLCAAVLGVVFVKIKPIIILISLFSMPVFADDCMDTAMTQHAMNACSYSKFLKADTEMKRVYKKILEFLKDDQVQADAVIKSQKAWLRYRDAQLEMYYPPRQPNNFMYYGSFQPVCDNGLYEEMTWQRVKELKEWLKTPDEGDMCSRNLIGDEGYAPWA